MVTDTQKSCHPHILLPIIVENSISQPLIVNGYKYQHLRCSFNPVNP
ncbi:MULTISPECIES: hypothetical protein [Nostocales]|jgi:hypothetical protein|uniref:Uncharacterized protein n=1 Tax=Aphanizomenon flos-aquae FACHB-1040 TaxID=2692887 RepID=A0ABR8C151_APHFL|nr:MULTISPECIES: hypothetical protein [Nostocales]MBD2279742.1 hypothetical protein [Aphanizomenon flos-aquae FACHB-1040]MBO1066412.1 hypothetical protein [Anabaena sp. 54]MBO1069842.1 hypothetical protein [Dolichospermum sp. DEX189]MCX5984100.1 hypothetical protein [Nostocales cyanobacterium LacPavin_0920_SED1_MAG_38_18]